MILKKLIILFGIVILSLFVLDELKGILVDVMDYQYPAWYSNCNMSSFRGSLKRYSIFKETVFLHLLPELKDLYMIYFNNLHEYEKFLPEGNEAKVE